MDEMKATDLSGEDRLLLVKIGKSAEQAADDAELYELARKWWKAAPAQVEKVRRVLGVHANQVVAAYEPTHWEVSTKGHRARAEIYKAIAAATKVGGSMQRGIRIRRLTRCRASPTSTRWQNTEQKLVHFSTGIRGPQMRSMKPDCRPSTTQAYVPSATLT